jgi:hypothetical protein
VRLAHPEHHRQQHTLAFFGKAPGDQHALLGPVGADREKDRVQEQRRHLDVVEVAALERLKALAQLGADPLGGRLRQLPEPAFSHSDSMSRIDSPRTNAPITIARSGSVRNTFLLHGNSLQTNDSAASRTCAISTSSSPSSVCTLRGAKPVAQAVSVVAQPALMRRPALIARPPQPRVELILNGALDDQPGPQPRQLRQRLARVLTHPHGKQPVDLRLDLRRRRYGTSHGVGPPSIVSSGLQGTYAVALTAPRLFTAPLRRDRPNGLAESHVPARDDQRSCRGVRPDSGRRSV